MCYFPEYLDDSLCKFIGWIPRCRASICLPKLLTSLPITSSRECRSAIRQIIPRFLAVYVPNIIRNGSSSNFIHSILSAVLIGMRYMVYIAVEYRNILRTAIMSLLVKFPSCTPFLLSTLILRTSCWILFITVSSLTPFYDAVIAGYISASLGFISLFGSWNLSSSFIYSGSSTHGSSLLTTPLHSQGPTSPRRREVVLELHSPLSAAWRHRRWGRRPTKF